jgi:tRNA dimethylallyltransferase
MQSDPQPLLIAVVGPTAVGKTEISLQLAERLSGEIVSADSRLLYRGMDIGTAKPASEEQMRVPHHLIDVTTPDKPWSLAVFQQEARRVISEVHARNRLPFLVGGTGQYIHAVIEEWSVPRVEPDPALRAVLESWAREAGANELHNKLARLDPDAAASIDPRNIRRTVRALEVVIKTGRPFSTQRQKSESPYRTLKIGLIRPRPELYARIDARIDAMISSGLVEEVRSLLSVYPPDLPPFSAIGYREVIDYLKGKTSLEEAVMLIKRSTRIFVRRQANWFKQKDPDIRWFQVGEKTAGEIEGYLRSAK